MKDISTKDMWNKAAGSALILALIPIAYSLASMFIGKMTGGGVMASFLTTVIMGILWLAKFTGCILLMRFFLKDFAVSSKEITRSDTYRYGLMISLMSAFICAAYFLVDVLYIQPDTYKEAMDTMIQANGAMIDSNTRDALEHFREDIPVIGFVCNLIYCFLFGMVLSSILSGRVTPDDTFESGADEQ